MRERERGFGLRNTQTERLERKIVIVWLWELFETLQLRTCDVERFYWAVSELDRLGWVWCGTGCFVFETERMRSVIVLLLRSLSQMDLFLFNPPKSTTIPVRLWQIFLIIFITNCWCGLLIVIEINFNFTLSHRWHSYFYWYQDQSLICHLKNNDKKIIKICGS